MADLAAHTVFNTVDNAEAAIKFVKNPCWNNAAAVAIAAVTIGGRKLLSKADDTPSGGGGGGGYRRPGFRPTNAPSGTLAINVHPDTRGRVHEIKRNLTDEQVGPASYVGIAPDGKIVLTNHDGSAEVLRHWTTYTNNM